MGDYGRSLRFGVLVNADSRGYEEVSALVRRADETGLWTSSAFLAAPTAAACSTPCPLSRRSCPGRSGGASSPTSPTCPSPGPHATDVARLPKHRLQCLGNRILG